MKPRPDTVTVNHVEDYAEALARVAVPAPPRAAPAPPGRRQSRARLTPEQRSGLRQWLLEGMTPAQIVTAARAIWQLEAATTRAALKGLRRRWAKAAGRADYLAHLWHAKGQREHLFTKIMRRLTDDTDLRQYTPTLRLAQQMLAERDELFATVRAHRQACRRDASPDQRAAQRPRPEEVILSVAEWHQRWEHYRNQLWAMWEQQRSADEAAAART